MPKLKPRATNSRPFSELLPMKSIIATIDTETCGLKDPVYDVGWQIHDKAGNLISEFHALVEEVFTNPDRMTRAHFARKVFSDYAPMLDQQVIRLRPWAEIVEELRAAVLDHDVNVVAAYNLGFDQRALGLTHRLLGNTGPILPRPAKSLDLWQFACEVLLNNRNFKRMATENGWISPAGNFRTNAEVAFRFLTGNATFEEDHTALSDANIERQIAAACFAKKKRIPYEIKNAQPWKIVNP